MTRKGIQAASGFVCAFVLCVAQGVGAKAASQFAVMGDSGRAGPDLNRLADSIAKENIQAIIMPGDNLYRGSYSAVWDSWKKAGFQFDVVAIGNHNGGYQKEIDYFKMPGEFYSVLKAGARFLVLNSDNDSNVEAQFAWLETEIATVDEDLIFLVYHHPTYTVSQSHKWKEKKKFQLRMRSFLKTHGQKITALLLGHDHMTSLHTFGEVPAIVAGSGREVRNEKAVSYAEEDVQVDTHYLAPRRQHWALLEIADGAREAMIHMISVRDQSRSCSVRFSQGRMNLLDNCR